MRVPLIASRPYFRASSFAFFFFVLLAWLVFSGESFGARPFVVGGRVLFFDRPFRPGASVVSPSPALTEPFPIVERSRPPQPQRTIEVVAPQRVVPHYLPQAGDYTPRRYPGLTVIPIPPQSAYTPDPVTALPRYLNGSIGGLPPTIPGPRKVTPAGLAPSPDPFRPSPFDPDVTRRQGFKRF